MWGWLYLFCKVIMRIGSYIIQNKIKGVISFGTWKSMIALTVVKKRSPWGKIMIVCKIMIVFDCWFIHGLHVK